MFPCSRNVSAFEALTAHTRATHHVAALALDEAKPSAMLAPSRSIDAAYWAPTDAVVQAHDLGSVPETLLISPGGRFRRRWVGPYTGMTKNSLEPSIITANT